MKDIVSFPVTTLSFFAIFYLANHNGVKLFYRYARIKFYKKFLKKMDKIFVSILRVEDNPNYLEFTFDKEVYNYTTLGRDLILVNGLTYPESNDLPLLMDLKGRHSFRLQKKKIFTWEEIVPGIKKIFKGHIKNVIFLGDFPDKTIKTKRRTAGSLL